MRLKFIKKLIKTVEESNIEELELRGPFRSVRITKRLTPSVQPVKKEIQTTEAIPKPQTENLIPIKAPMVGTFFSAPSPGDPPYVEVGDTVTPDKIVCTIEAMKVMNEIEADASGKIVKVLVENEQPVEFGQELFLVEPT